MMANGYFFCGLKMRIDASRGRGYTPGMRIIRVFPRKTKATPTDALA